jgi:hypothetical protein
LMGRDSSNMSVVNLNHRISSLSRRSHVIILLGIGVNCFITVSLLCSLLQGADLPLALSDPGQLRYGYGETSTSTSTSSISSSTSTSTRTITPLMPWASVSSISSHDSQDSLEVRRLLGCDHTNWGECVRAASKLASSQAVYAMQFATHKWQAFQRAMQGPTEYDSIKLFPYKHPVTVPLDPRFQPRPEWDNDRAFPDISICGLPKAGSSQLHTILKNHVGGVQFGRIKEQCTSRDDYRSIFEDWDEVPIDENQAIANDRQLHVQLQLYLYYEKLFSREISFRGPTDRDHSKLLITIVTLQKLDIGVWPQKEYSLIQHRYHVSTLYWRCVTMSIVLCVRPIVGTIQRLIATDRRLP